MVDIRPWFKDTITVAPMTGASDVGEPTYGDKYTVKCRVERAERKVVAGDGQEHEYLALSFDFKLPYSTGCL